MKRIELFEFEDFPWLPKTIRTGITNLIQVFHRMVGTAGVLETLISKIREDHPFSQITDLGSGSGGPMPEVVEKINQKQSQHPIKLVLTDLHPNPAVVEAINGRNMNSIRYHEKPVDATNISEAPEGLKTMVGSFHHMDPSTAAKILLSAQKNKQPLLIYEVAKNNIPVLLWWLFLPLSLLILIVMSLLMTPFVRPLSFTQLLFTYLIPVIPIVYAWDGQASLMRTYTFEDVNSLLDGQRDPDYQWTVADAKKANGKKTGYYILGLPKS